DLLEPADLICGQVELARGVDEVADRRPRVLRRRRNVGMRDRIVMAADREHEDQCARHRPPPGGGSSGIIAGTTTGTSNGWVAGLAPIASDLQNAGSLPPWRPT